MVIVLESCLICTSVIVTFGSMQCIPCLGMAGTVGWTAWSSNADINIYTNMPGTPSVGLVPAEAYSLNQQIILCTCLFKDLPTTVNIALLIFTSQDS